VIVKNNTSNNGVWVGQSISANQSYTILESEIENWRNDDTVVADITLGILVANNGSEDLTPSDGIRLLLRSIVEVSSLPEAMPFAKNLYRLKLNASGSVTTVAPNASGESLLKMDEERFVSGGTLVVKNAEFGDYISAEIADVDGIIPLELRASLCENWPTAVKYIEKQIVELSGGTYSVHKIIASPLNGQIAAGLYLKINYFATISGSTREFYINYNLTKRI